MKIAYVLRPVKVAETAKALALALLLTLVAGNAAAQGRTGLSPEDALKDIFDEDSVRQGAN